MSNKICCILDACTVINLIHIDEDDFLLKKLNKLDIHINEAVFNEIRCNVDKGIDSKNNDKNSTSNLINHKLSFFRTMKKDNKEMLTDLGNDYFERIKNITNYTKKSNGELLSSAYALYLSRMNETKVFFYTDDFPAKEFFSSFFEYQQIGHIKDSVDLLVLLYWLDENFSKLQLDHYLSSLFSQYAKDVVLLKKKLQDYYDNNVDGSFRRNKRDVAVKLNQLLHKLEKNDFKNIGSLFLFFENPKNKEVFEILKKYSGVFELENNSNSDTLLGKISKIRTDLEGNKIYKWNDLIIV